MMTRSVKYVGLIAIAAFLLQSRLEAQTLDTTLTYQGLLKDSDAKITGQVDLEFSMFDADTTGVKIGATLSASNVDVVDGLFTVELDFGADALNGGDRWLEIAVANPAGGSFTTLSPRQPLTASPFAIQTRGIAVDDLGNVGIGTGSPLSPLHIEGTARASAFSIHNPNNLGASANLSWFNDVPRIRYGGSGVGSHDGFAIHGTGDSVKLRLLDSGALGVGTEFPTSVISNAKLAVAWGHVAIYNDYGLFSYNSTGDGIGAGMDTTTGDNLELYAGGASRMTVESTGDVGIGTTSPAATLDVRGRLVLDDGGDALVYTAATGGEQSRYLKILNSTTQASASGLMAGGVLVSDDYNYASPDKDELIVKGNVSIGTTDPHATLHVSSDDFLGVKITQTNDNDYARLMLDGNGQHLVQLNLGAAGTSLPGTFNIYRPGTGNMLSIAPNGDVGIGTSSPGQELDVRGDVDIIDSRPELSLSNSADSEGITLEYRENLDELRIQNRTNHGDTFESQIAVFQASGNVGIGTGTPNSKLEVNGRITTDELEITGGSDLSEQFDIDAGDAEVHAGMVACIDPSNPGKLIICGREYDPTVAGVVSGAAGVKPGMLMGQKGTPADGEHPVALTGRVYVQATTSNGPVRPGDMLTTSATPGYAMKATDRRRAFGATIGKAMTALENGEGLVLVLVSLQ